MEPQPQLVSNVLELLGMLVEGARGLGRPLVVKAAKPRQQRREKYALLRGNNEAGVAWIQRCRAVKSRGPKVSMRTFGVIEESVYGVHGTLKSRVSPAFLNLVC